MPNHQVALNCSVESTISRAPMPHVKLSNHIVRPLVLTSSSVRSIGAAAVAVAAALAGPRGTLETGVSSQVE